ncbi:cytochrome P450 [Archangium violaceum]|uniref:cytochrome P450 n=1 Tax=Archangium violaceum TaxID=83451 RepID=UPI002B2CB78B|nr:cytochrome P450 [Archangium violaceum]
MRQESIHPPPSSRRPPGPRGLRFLRGLPDMLGNPLRFLREVASEYGEVISLGHGMRPFYLVVHPLGVKQVLQDNAARYKKSDLTTQKFKPFLGKGLVVSEGGLWRSQRRLMGPCFTRQKLERLFPLMAQVTQEMLERWRELAARGQPLDMGEEMKRLTLGIASRTMFSTDVSGDADLIGPAIRTAQHYVARQMTSMTGLANYLLLPQRAAFRQATDDINSVVLRIIRQRRQNPDDKGDLLSALLLAQDAQTGQCMDDAQLLDEVKGILVAGFESTATVLTWAWYLLDQHPEARQRLEAEAREVLGGRAPTLDDLPRLVYTRAVFEEALRLYPPVWMTLRTPLEDDCIGGYRIPAGSVVLLSPYVTQRLPELWPRPDDFEPERFAPERSAERSRFAYFPFGGGPRTCMGNGFALMEAQVILAMVAARYRLALVPGQRVEPLPLLTLQPRYPFQMKAIPTVDSTRG